MITISIMEIIYRKIEAEGVWLFDPKQTTREQQDAILALRKCGRIEQAAYGGLKIKRDWRVKVEPPKDDVSQILYIAVSPRKVVVMLKNGQGYNFRGEPEYLAGLKTLAQSLGKGQALPGRNGVLAYGQIGVLLGKHSKVA